MDFTLTQHVNKMVDISNSLSTDYPEYTEYTNYINDLKKIKEYKKSLTVRRTEFEALDLEKVNYIKACLLVIYGLLVLWFAYIMFKNKDLKLKQKGILISAMVAYPFIAPPLLIYLYEMIMYIKALMTGEIYKKAELQ